MKDIEITLRDGGNYTIKKEQLEFWSFLYPNLDIYKEIINLKKMWDDDILFKKTSKNVNKFINNYLLEKHNKFKK